MSILDLARMHTRQILGDQAGGFATSITFTAPDGGPEVTGSGTHSKIHSTVEMDTNRAINVRRAHVTVNETAFFIETGYPYTNANGEVNLRGHLVKVADVTGAVYQYAVDEWFPDKTLGAIVVFLKDYE